MQKSILMSSANLENQGGRNGHFLAQGRPWPAWSSQPPAKKLLARSWADPDNFIKILQQGQKLLYFLAGTYKIFCLRPSAKDQGIT